MEEKPRKVPALPTLFAEIVRFDAETEAMRTSIPFLPGYRQRRSRRRELSAAAAELLKRSGTGASA